MPDSAVKTAFRYTACRRSAFTPLVGFKWEKSKPALLAVTDKVRARWLWNADRLTKAGWLAKVPTGKNVFGCVTVGRSTSGVFRACNRPVVCPFCFARHYVLDPFIRLEKHQYGDDYRNPKAERLPYRHTVVVGFRSKYESDRDGVGFDVATGRVLNGVRLEQKKFKSLVGSTLGTTLIQVWPKERGVEGCISGVHLVECDTAEEVAAYPSIEKLKQKAEAKGLSCDKIVISRNPTKKALASVYGKAILLPKAYYERPPEECVAVLNAIANTRLFFRLTGKREA